MSMPILPTVLKTTAWFSSDCVTVFHRGVNEGHVTRVYREASRSKIVSVAESVSILRGSSAIVLKG